MTTTVRYGTVDPPLGKDGKDGKPGKPGETGEAGRAGEQGEQGLPPPDPVPHVVDVEDDFIVIDYTVSKNWHLKLHNNPLITFTPKLPTGVRVRVEIWQGVGGPFTVVWGGDVRWPGDAEPVLTETAQHADVFEIEAWDADEIPPRNMGFTIGLDINLESMV